MEPIKVSVDVTVDLSESSKAFVTALFAKSSTPASEAPAASAKPAAPAKPAPAKPTTSAPASTTITIEDVRKALAEKVKAHRNEMKDELSAVGAPSVTKLDQSKYQEMYDFLIALD